MDQPIGFERWEPGHPWGDVLYADGTRTSVPDPDGSIESQARDYGARFNAQPKSAPDPVPQPSLTGAASPPPAPSTPSPEVPAGPPGGASLPSGAPLTSQEKAPLQASPQELQALQGPTTPPGVPDTGQSPAAQALADHGITPDQLPKVGAAPGAPGAIDPLSPALAAVKQHAPQLVASKGEVKVEGPDAESKAAIEQGSTGVLGLKGQAIDQSTQAKSLNLDEQGQMATSDYQQAYRNQQAVLGQQGALTAARDEASAKLAAVKQAPIADHPDFPDWFVATSILGAIAGGFNQGFTGGAYKSTTLPMLHQLVSDWKDNQRQNKSSLVSSLEEQLGDKNAAMMAAGSKIKDELANMAEAKARYAKTVEAQRELAGTATGLRASALEDWTKAQAVTMGKVSENVSLALPAAKVGLNNSATQELGKLGVSPKLYQDGLEKKVLGDTTLDQAINNGMQMDSDLAALKTLAAQNGSKLQGKGLVTIPAALAPTLSRLGIKSGMQQEETQQIFKSYLIRQAKAMGSRITDNELSIANDELGSSTEGFFRALGRIRGENDEAIRSTAQGVWPGVAQQVIDLHRRYTSGVTGLPHTEATPLEKTNGPETPTAPAAPKKDMVNSTASPEEQASIDAQVAQSRADEQKASDTRKTEAEAEVARRRERPIPGSKF